MSKVFNGLKKNVIVLMSNDIHPTIYYPFPSKVEVDVRPDDYENVEVLINKFSSKASIIIDSRLEYLILVAHIHHPGYPLIYDANNSDVIDVYQWMSGRSVFNMKGVFIYTASANKLIDLYVFIKYFCNHLKIKWDSFKAKEFIGRNSTFVDIAINYIGIEGIPKYEPDEKTERNVNLIRQTVEREAFSVRRKLCDNVDELFTALFTLRSAGVNLITY